MLSAAVTDTSRSVTVTATYTYYGITKSKTKLISIMPPQTASGIPFSWLQLHDLPTDGSVDNQRLFGSTFTVLQHWFAGTDPNDRDTDLRMTDAPIKQPQGFAIRWRSVATRTYRIERSSDLKANPAFTPLEGATGLQGVDGIREYVDDTATGPGPFFYRAVVE